MTSRRGTRAGVWQGECGHYGEAHSPSWGPLSHHMLAGLPGNGEVRAISGEGQTGPAKGGKTLWSAGLGGRKHWPQACPPAPPQPRAPCSPSSDSPGQLKPGPARPATLLVCPFDGSLISTEQSLLQRPALTFQACLSLTSMCPQPLQCSPRGSTSLGWPWSSPGLMAGPPSLPQPCPKSSLLDSPLGWVYTGSCDIINTLSCGDSTSQFTWRLRHSPTAQQGRAWDPAVVTPEMGRSALLQEALLWGAEWLRAQLPPLDPPPCPHLCHLPTGPCCSEPEPRGVDQHPVWPFLPAAPLPSPFPGFAPGVSCGSNLTPVPACQRAHLTPSFYRWGNRGFKVGSDLPKVREPKMSRASSQHRFLPSIASSHCLTPWTRY